jgi:DNA-binding MarR family transcriptional regulator
VTGRTAPEARRAPAEESRVPAEAGRVPAQDDAARLYLVIGRLVRMLRRSDGGELSPGVFSALATLARSGPLRLGDLAVREGVRPPTLSRIVAALDERGLVERQPDPDDGRAVLVAASAAGADLVAELRTARADELRRRFEALPDRQRELLVAALPALEALAEPD